LKPEWTRLAKYATVVFYDQRGVGKSDTADCYSWRADVLDLYRLIARVAPARKVILAGSFWGVDLSLLFAHCYPGKVQGLILSGITPWKGRGFPSKDCSLYNSDAMENKSAVAELQKSIDGLQKTLPMHEPPRTQVLRTATEDSLMMTRNTAASERIQFWTLSSLEDAPGFEELSISSPAIIFQGDEECMFPDLSGRFSRKLKSCRVVYIEKSCHDPWLGNPDKFFSEAGEFIEGLQINENR
jgi:pimeloyl-ACP methyl ester carboxylesterase